MKKITSFTIDHIKLQPGLYVSRKDKVGSETITTFDLRLTKPNDEPVMNTAEIHTMEHLAATYLPYTVTINNANIPITIMTLPRLPRIQYKDIL